MAVGDCERAFQEAAMQDGVKLHRYKLPWINQQGHFGLPARAGAAKLVLHEIFLGMGGDAVEQAGKRSIALPGDLIHEPTRTVIEVDESQHFTSFRLKTLEMYPSDYLEGVNLAEYRELCLLWAARSDGYRRTKPAVAFGLGGRQRQRAYYDALRDLALPAMGYPSIIRVSEFDGDGHAAYWRNRDRIRAALEQNAAAAGPT